MSPEPLVAHRCFTEGGGRTRDRPEDLRGCAMLESLSDQVRECLRHADDCVQQAASQTDPKLRQDYLIIAACWLKLCYELSDRLADFSKSKSTEPLHRVSSAAREPHATTRQSARS